MARATPARGLATFAVALVLMSTPTPPAHAALVRSGANPATATSPSPASPSPASPPLPAAIAAIPKSTDQVITVEAADYSTTWARLTTWERVNGQWRRLLTTPARVGYAGLSNRGVGKRTQGDYSTPTGLYAVGQGFGVGPNPGTRMPWFTAGPNDFWAIDPKDPSTYNIVQHARPVSALWRMTEAEHLIRFGPTYEVAFEIGFNRPRGVREAPDGQRVATVPANTTRGGAIFLHVNDGSKSTAGCVSVSRTAMLAIARWLNPSRAPMIAIGTTDLLKSLPAPFDPAATPPVPARQPTAVITPAAGCHPLGLGYTGVKVKLVQRRLGFPATTWELYDRRTVAAVKRFQVRHGLRATGITDRRTWNALGLAKRGYGFCMDAYQRAPQVPTSATPAQRIEAMIAEARRYVGTEYVWGGSGRPGQGVDCSGLVLQSLYAAGLDTRPVSVDLHIAPGYGTGSALAAVPDLIHVPIEQARRGDIVFWAKASTGRMQHVAIYLGNGKVIEAIEPRVHIGTFSDRTSAWLMPFAIRPFPDMAPATTSSRTAGMNR